MADEGAFDIIILGTGLVESIAAAALSKAGFKVAHIDNNPYYGADEASLSLEEFIEWTDKDHELFSAFSGTHTKLPHARQYSISLSPSVIPSVGPLISSLVASGVSRYGGFQLVERVGIYDASSGTVKGVPGSKEDVFKNKDISLVDKRRLMRFLMFASGEFEGKPELEGREEMAFGEFLKTAFMLNDETVAAILYALAFCFTAQDPTLYILRRLRRYLCSTGRYGSSPFLVGHYGSSGEIAQGFCRTAAVAGGVYILSRTMSSITYSDSRYTVTLNDFPEPLTCRVLISSATHLPSNLALHQKRVAVSSLESISGYCMARCVAIIDQPLSFGTKVRSTDEDTEEPPLDTGILVFPPNSLTSSSAAAIAFVVGQGSLSTPKDRWILYLSMPIHLSEIHLLSPEIILTPYMTAALKTSPSPTPPVPLFTSFYLQNPPSAENSGSKSDLGTCLVSPQLPIVPLPDTPDLAVEYAEAVFREAIKALRPDEEADFWPPLEEVDAEEESF
ncbi:GDP dissociation inhibitor-domain-containing protein [Desarmillaria tabescens]|uniref:GDP dissociation inhibitor-domain-containing protein n=1 Tax=Armillaria tabescens TaxID=1929756 RepID=A0AA39NPR6_ARMTA|nr:GDP dissociation inhibitor-domain-containing protein [Desarmillaria tabescens]KAK0469548.1 GDP dissociation inhibitor-domain-containing protein [Desarmillaria tabescens]